MKTVIKGLEKLSLIKMCNDKYIHLIFLYIFVQFVIVERYLRLIDGLTHSYIDVRVCTKKKICLSGNGNKVQKHRYRFNYRLLVLTDGLIGFTYTLKQFSVYTFAVKQLSKSIFAIDRKQ